MDLLHFVKLAVQILKMLNMHKWSVATLALGKTRACKGASQERSLGVTSYVLGSVRECEGMNTHIPK
jgi:hypothetical protein